MKALASTKDVMFIVLLNLTLGSILIAQNGSPNIGNASVTTWYNNKKAAASLTFDDNYCNQFAVALPYLDALGIKATFFVVTSRPDQGFGGVTWDIIRAAASSGHEIASHSVSHPEPPLYPKFLIDLNPDQLEYEITWSKKRIEEEVPNQKCLTFAYPGSSYVPRLGKAVEPLYIAARCGHWQVESANPYYFWHIVSYGPYTATPLQQMNQKCDEAIYRGGWFVERFHGVDGEGYEPITGDVLRQHFNYIKSKESDLWTATFVDVVKYIRERNAAFIFSISVSETDILLDARDNLPDEIYDMKLTVAVNVPNDWNIAYYQQGNFSDSAETKKVNGQNMAFINVTPDRGLIKIACNRHSIFTSIDKVQLKAEAENGRVVLAWTGTAPNNVYGFEVERIALFDEASSDWETLGFIQANITPNSKSYYFIDDEVKPGSYRYRLKALYKTGDFGIMGEIQLTIGLPSQFVLYQNYPNPFNASTVIPFDLLLFENNLPVVIKLFNVYGQEVTTLLEANLSSGHHEVIFNGNNLPSGEYFYSIKVDGMSDMKKLLLLK